MKNFILAVPHRQLEDAEYHLDNNISFNRSDDCVYCWTCALDAHWEVDVKVVDAPADSGGPWTEAVLFHDGHEIGCTDVDDSIRGEWAFAADADFEGCIVIVVGDDEPEAECWK